jgi:methenyltetrahydromethanopterin cyclohydrolase
MTTGISLNGLAGQLADAMVRDAAQLRIAVQSGPRGETLIDCGAAVRGGIEAGLRLAEITLGGLGKVRLVPSEGTPHWPWQVAVTTSDPVLACLASQYAGWALNHEGPDGSFSALGSGPARALARREPLFGDISHAEATDRAVLVVEAGAPPPAPVLDRVADACGVRSDRLTVLFAPTSSLAGSLQVVARVVEVAMHKAHELKFPLQHIVDAAGSAPLSPPHPDFSTGMGRTNDAIIFGGRVHLFVAGPAAAAKDLADALPSTTSRDYGASFSEIFRRAGGDFYAIDPMLFSPAAVAVTALETGETFRAGAVAADLLDASFR